MTAAAGDGSMSAVVKAAWLPDARTMRIAQHLADKGLAKHDSPDEATVAMDLHSPYACHTPVERHQDLHGTPRQRKKT